VTAVNPYEEAARERKAQALADALDAMGILPADASMLSPSERALTARVAGVHLPSPATWALACAKLAARYELRARLGVGVQDPFDGIGA
jgi:hypothetical protein